MLWDQWAVSTLINKNPSKFAHFCFHQTCDFTLFVLWDHQQGRQARLVHLVIYSIAYQNLCMFAAEWWCEACCFDEEGSVAFKRSGCRKLENCSLASWANAHNGHLT